MSPTFAVTGPATKAPVDPTRSSLTTVIEAGGAGAIGAVFWTGAVLFDGVLVDGVDEVHDVVPPFIASMRRLP